MMAGPSSRTSDAMDVDMDAPPKLSNPNTSIQARPPVSVRAPPGPRATSVPINPPDYTVGFVYSTEMTSHFSPHGHPEDPNRITRIWQAIVGKRYTQKMKWLPIRPVRKEEALLVHSEDHWDKVQAIQCKL